MGSLAHSPAAATDIATSTEDTARLGFESGESAFMVNYTFAYGSARRTPPTWPRTWGSPSTRGGPGKPSRPPLGGFNLGVGAFSDNPDLAFQAAACLSNPKSQLTATELDGLPPSRNNLYEQGRQEGLSGIRAAGPALDRVGGPRRSPPPTGRLPGDPGPIQPPDKIDPNDAVPSYDDLRGNVEDAVERKGLL